MSQVVICKSMRRGVSLTVHWNPYPNKTMVSLISLKPNSRHQTNILQSHFRVSIFIILAPGKEPCSLVISSSRLFLYTDHFSGKFYLTLHKNCFISIPVSDCPKTIPFSAAQDHIAYTEYFSVGGRVWRGWGVACVTDNRRRKYH